MKNILTAKSSKKHCKFLTMFNTLVGAGAAPGYGSGSDQKMLLLAAPAPQHWSKLLERGDRLHIQYILNKMPYFSDSLK
jgi:hypothetical protein